MKLIKVVLITIAILLPSLSFADNICFDDSEDSSGLACYGLSSSGALSVNLSSLFIDGVADKMAILPVLTIGGGNSSSNSAGTLNYVVTVYDQDNFTGSSRTFYTARGDFDGRLTTDNAYGYIDLTIPIVNFSNRIQSIYVDVDY